MSVPDMPVTEHFLLRKPRYGDPADVADINYNTEIIDDVMSENRQMIADAYSNAQGVTYDVGDVCEYNGDTYECIGATSGNWDSTKWTRKSLGQMISEQGGGGSSTLAGLTDVDLSSPSDGQILKYNASTQKWENGTGGAVSINDLTDVTITTPTNGQMIKYNSTSGKWENYTPTINDLDDVNIATPTNGQTLIYDDTDDEWKNQDMPDASVTKEVSGNPVEFTDGASAPLVKCVTEIQGSQDLHGYDKPWVGGAGKNKLPMTVDGIKSFNSAWTWNGNSSTVNGLTFTILTDNDENVIGIKVTGTANSDTVMVIHNHMENIITPGTSVIMNGCPSDGSGSKYRMYAYTIGYDYGTGISGTIPTTQCACGIEVINGYVIPTDGIVFYPMIRLSTETDSTFAPYSNICPITAYTEGEIEVRGKNKFSDTLYKDNYGINSSGSEYASNSYYIAVENLSPSENYVISATYNGTSQSQVLRVQYYDSDDNVLSMDSVRLLVNARTILAFTTPASTAYAHISINKQNTDIQIESGTTATTYEPYTSTTHTTTYPSAIYRGSEDVVNGEVTSDMPVADMGDLTWSAYTTDTTGHSFYVNVPNGTKSVSSDSSVANMVCENYETVAFINPSEWLRRDAIICQVPNAQRWIVRDERYSDVTSFTSAVTGVKIAYELATPTTSSVTPTNLPVKSLNGYNHIESSTGDLEVEYITSKYQPLVNLMKNMVVANPSEDATDNLSKLKVDGTVYALPSGGIPSIATQQVSFSAS